MKLSHYLLMINLFCFSSTLFANPFQLHLNNQKEISTHWRKQLEINPLALEKSFNPEKEQGEEFWEVAGCAFAGGRLSNCGSYIKADNRDKAYWKWSVTKHEIFLHYYTEDQTKDHFAQRLNLGVIHSSKSKEEALINTLNQALGGLNSIAHTQGSTWAGVPMGQGVLTSCMPILSNFGQNDLSIKESQKVEIQAIICEWIYKDQFHRTVSCLINNKLSLEKKIKLAEKYCSVD